MYYSAAAMTIHSDLTAAARSPLSQGSFIFLTAWPLLSAAGLLSTRFCSYAGPDALAFAILFL
jgi:hypothetical protein